MSVLVEGFSVIVKKETLLRKYPGGQLQYWIDCPNSTFCADSHLVRVGFMAASDVRVWVDRLEVHGFILEDERARSVDVAVVDQLDGLTRECDWLLNGIHKDGFALAWLKGSDPSDMYYPRGWNYENSLSKNFNRVLKRSQQKTWIEQATRGLDGLLHRKDPVTDRVHNTAILWGPDEPNKLN